MKAVHQENEKGRADVGVVEEAEEVEQRKDGQVESRQEALQVVVKLKEKKQTFFIRVSFC